MSIIVDLKYETFKAMWESSDREAAINRYQMIWISDGTTLTLMFTDPTTTYRHTLPIASLRQEPKPTGGIIPQVPEDDEEEIIPPTAEADPAEDIARFLRSEFMGLAIEAEAISTGEGGMTPTVVPINGSLTIGGA